MTGFTSKRPWQSRTIWGGVLMLVALILSAGFGVELTAEDREGVIDNLLVAIEAISGVAGFIMVLYGRITATKSVTL